VSISATVAAISAVLTPVTSLVSVLDHLPQQLSSAALPAACITPDAGESRWQATGYLRSQRTYLIYLVITPITQQTPAQREIEARDTLQDVLSALLASPNLGGAVDHVARISDNGVATITVAGMEYLGCVLRLEVVEKWS